MYCNMHFIVSREVMAVQVSLEYASWYITVYCWYILCAGICHDYWCKCQCSQQTSDTPIHSVPAKGLSNKSLLMSCGGVITSIRVITHLLEWWLCMVSEGRGRGINSHYSIVPFGLLICPLWSGVKVKCTLFSLVILATTSSTLRSLLFLGVTNPHTCA